jgi:hypothetical protein
VTILTHSTINYGRPVLPGKAAPCAYVSRVPCREAKLNAATKAKRSPGRPTRYSPEAVLEICRRMELGESLRQICATPGMPGRTTVMRWLESQPEFRESYARARERLVEFWADEIIEIADDTEKDFVDGKVDHEHINRSRLRVDARKWLMSKLARRKYGDRVTTEVVGDPENPTPQHEVIVTFVAATKDSA